MLLSILVFFAVSGAVVGAYYALVHRPEHQVERTFEQRLKELSTFDSETPGAAQPIRQNPAGPRSCGRRATLGWARACRPSHSSGHGGAGCRTDGPRSSGRGGTGRLAARPSY